MMRPYLLLSAVLASAITCTGGEIEVVQAADQCTSQPIGGGHVFTLTSGLLEMEPVPQEEDVWCWAASATAVLKRLSVRDGHIIGCGHPGVNCAYSQCRLYSIGNALHPGVDCCQQCPTHPCGVSACKEVGWPEDVFDKFDGNFGGQIPNRKIHYLQGGQRNWNEVQASICPPGAPGPGASGRPFIYVARPQNGIPHTYVVKGFNEYGPNGKRGIYVDSHSMLGSNPKGGSFVDFDCDYTGTCPNSVYQHIGDYFDIRLVTQP